jgi:hypothetical protein
VSDAASYPGCNRAPRGAFPPVKEIAIRSAQESLGFPLPLLLQEVYMHVGNGGFGPGYGIIGLEKGQGTDEGHSMVERYHLDREGDPECPHWIWPEKLIMICNWGCAMYSCIDCSSPEAPVVRFDLNGLDSERGEGWQDAFWMESDSFYRQTQVLYVLSGANISVSLPSVKALKSSRASCIFSFVLTSTLLLLL